MNSLGSASSDPTAQLPTALAHTSAASTRFGSSLWLLTLSAGVGVLLPSICHCRWGRSARDSFLWHAGAHCEDAVVATADQSSRASPAVTAARSHATVLRNVAAYWAPWLSWHRLLAHSEKHWQLALLGAAFARRQTLSGSDSDPQPAGLGAATSTAAHALSPNLRLGLR
jgi:hypothetical protein